MTTQDPKALLKEYMARLTREDLEQHTLELNDMAKGFKQRIKALEGALRPFAALAKHLNRTYRISEEMKGAPLTVSLYRLGHNSLPNLNDCFIAAKLLEPDHD